MHCIPTAVQCIAVERSLDEINALRAPAMETGTHAPAMGSCQPCKVRRATRLGTQGLPGCRGFFFCNLCNVTEWISPPDRLEKLFARKVARRGVVGFRAASETLLGDQSVWVSRLGAVLRREGQLLSSNAAPPPEFTGQGCFCV